MFFCPVIESLTKSLESPLTVWYLDDGTICGKIGLILSESQVVIEDGKKLGLELNPTKCELFAFGGSLQQRHANEDAAAISCPGIPSGTDLSFSKAPLTEKGLKALFSTFCGALLSGRFRGRYRNSTRWFERVWRKLPTSR
ncbi:hypothetical protein RvY_03061 [Ramazzottius varieornatus]|uniref:Reverse transcriptase domain-containing protein n=1 Tax=Ramazzottius varieornatus TaxID=947166 RepID=A0A1D1ULS0_RAMVA|nr:hypothetical protein RvY_03061 [Ramazzottius varieornatus]